MADVPEGYYSDPYGAEDLEQEAPELSESRKLAEDAQPEPKAEAADAEQHVEAEQEPQPEMGGEDFKEGAQEGAENGHPHLMPHELSEYEIPEESEVDLSRETEPQEVQLEGFVEMGEELLQDLEVFEVENHEPDLELPKETESEVPGATISETRSELQENILKESPREQGGEIELPSTDLTKPKFPSEKPRNSIKEAEIQPPEMTPLEIPEMTQRKSLDEKRTEPSEQVKPELPEETQRKSAEEIGKEPSEQTKSEFPDQTPSKSPEETQRKSAEEKVPETLEEIKSEFQEEKSRKPSEERGVEPSEMTKPVQEETQRKSSAEKVLEPPEDSKPAHQKDKPRKSTEETGVAQPQKATSGETLRTSESIEKRSQVPPQKTEPEVQEKTQTEPIEEKDLELTDEEKGLHRKDTHVEFVKEYEAESIQSNYSRGVVVDYDSYQRRKFHKRGKKGSLSASEADSTSTDYGFYKTFQNAYENVYDSEYDYSLVDHYDFQESTTENGSVDLSSKLEDLVPRDKKRQSRSSFGVQQFDYLTWSPEKVAEWISKLGFPQYKECFTTNFISGRKLIHVNCSNLPQIGITDFEDMKVISQHTRELLGIEEPSFSRSISLPYRDTIGLFLEQKSHSGVKSDSLTFSEYVEAAGLQDYAPQITDPEPFH
ncbi:sterile alpha motif domain-containing protein 15 [Talpa occidentalis]|uniref:sterile alpha motif domain-containing protein 15 n=1 Tax=Talpa occidentalis TaxID=50954 RepID=UPI00188E6B78|nr:sterile alpha motif domain-containing protein 15 [Talpa occidentalis]